MLLDAAEAPERDGARVVEWSECEAGSLAIETLAGELAARLTRASAAWHFWHLWPRFLARAERGVEPGAALGPPVSPGPIG